MDRVYTEHDIKVLQGLEVIRKRPAMYGCEPEDEAVAVQLVLAVLAPFLDIDKCGVVVRIVIGDGDIAIRINAALAFPEDMALSLGGSREYAQYLGNGASGLAVVNALSLRFDLDMRSKEGHLLQTCMAGRKAEMEFSAGDAGSSESTILFYPDKTVLPAVTFSHEIALMAEERLSAEYSDASFMVQYQP